MYEETLATLIIKIPQGVTMCVTPHDDGYTSLLYTLSICNNAY